MSWSGGTMIFDCDSVEDQYQKHGDNEFNRLTSRVAGAGAPQGNYTFSYNRWGNRLSQTSSPGGPYPNAAVDPTTNRIVGYNYDAAGNLMSDGLPHSFTYDAGGNVVQVNGGSSGSYIYDALNQRVSVQTSSGTLEYLFDPFGRRTSTWLTTRKFGIEGRSYWDGNQIAYRGQSGPSWFEHKSVLGTERLRTNYEGTAAATESSLAFGDGLNQNVLIAGADKDNSQYAGPDYDTESSSQHAMFRQYSSTIGRWMSLDPSDASYSLGNPQSFNRYSYALNTPFSATDPSGLDPESDTGDRPVITESISVDGGVIAGIDIWGPSSDNYSSFFDSAAFLIPYIPLQRFAPNNRMPDKKLCASRVAAGVQQNTGMTPTKLQYTGTIGGHANYSFDVSDPTGFKSILSNNPPFSLPFGIDQGYRYGVIQSTHVDNTLTGGFRGHPDIFSGHSIFAPLHLLIDVARGHIPGVNLDFGCKAGS